MRHPQGITRAANSGVSLACRSTRLMILFSIFFRIHSHRARVLSIPVTGVFRLPLGVAFRISAGGQAMQPRRRIEPVESLADQADYRSTQRKVPRLKSFDARIERREPLPVQVYLANLEQPRARERTVTEDVSPHGARVLTKRCWQPGEVPLVTPLMGEFPKRSEEHTSELQSQSNLVCRLLLEKKIRSPVPAQGPMPSGPYKTDRNCNQADSGFGSQFGLQDSEIHCPPSAVASVHEPRSKERR